MKTIILILVSLIISFASFSQNSNGDKEAITIIEQRAFYLNGTLNADFGGNDRVFIKIDLPKNTMFWYYSFSTSAGKSGAKTLNLLAQITSLMVDPSGLTAGALSKIQVPAGSSYVDVFLLDAVNLTKFTKSESFSYIPEGSTKNTKNAPVRIDDVTSGTWYIGIRNPSTFEGVNVSIEVIAITKAEVIDKNSPEYKYFYGIPNEESTANLQVSVDPDTKKIVYREVVTMDGSKDSLYNRAMAWINSFYKNPQSVTTMRDPENGVILCAHRIAMKETDKDGNVMTSNVIVEYKLKIEAKEGRYRYTFDEFRKKDVSMFPLERWLDKADPQYTPKCDEYLAQVDVKIKEIIASLKKGMERKVVKTDEW